MESSLTCNHGDNNHLPTPWIAISSVAETQGCLQKKQEDITINTEELSTKRANLFQIQVYFKHDPEVGGRGAGKGEGRGEKGKKCQPAKPMNLPNAPQLVATDCFSGNAFAANENLVHLFLQKPQIYSNSNGNKVLTGQTPTISL